MTYDDLSLSFQIKNKKKIYNNKSMLKLLLLLLLLLLLEYINYINIIIIINNH